MVSKVRHTEKAIKRFTVSLKQDDYERLRALADDHRPRLSLQYVVEYAVASLLDRAEDPQFILDLGNPLRHEP